MNFPPMVAPRMPNSYPQSMPSGVAYGAPIAVAGAVASSAMGPALGCPHGMGCGQTQEMEQLRGPSEMIASMPTWVKVIAGLSLASLLVLLVVKLARR